MPGRSGLLALALTAAAGIFGLVFSGSAQADTAVPLPIAGFHQMVVDAAHGHIFISQGSASLNDILVTDLTGQVVTTITGQSGVMGIALSPDGATLYAALSSAGAVSAISTATLQQTASYQLPAGDTPLELAVQSGKVWVSYNSPAAQPGFPGFEGAIGDIDVSAPSPAFSTQAAMGGWYRAPELAADPENTGVLIALGSALTPPALASYNTSADPVTVRAQSSSVPACQVGEDIAVVPGGQEFDAACPGTDSQGRFSTADLSLIGSYPSAGNPDAVAIDADGDVAAGTGFPYSPDLYIYSAGGTTPLNTYSLNSSGDYLWPRGLAWLPDGSQLFVMLQTDNAAEPFSLDIIDDPTLIPADLSLTGPSAAYIGNGVTLTGSLTVGTAPAPAGIPIAITRTTAGSTQTATFTVTTSAQGGFALADTLPAPGVYTYTASYGGNTQTASATATQTVSVSADPTVVSLAETGSGLAGPVTFTAGVTDAANDLNSPVTAGTVSFYDNGAATPIATALSGTGQQAGIYTATVSYTAAGPHSVVAMYTPPPGNPAYQPSASAPVTFAEAPPICDPCTDVQTIEGTIPAGALAISTPYSPANPLNLGVLTADPTGTFFTASAPLEPDSGNVPTAGQVPDSTFNGITVVDTQAGNLPWSITAIASDLSDGGSSPGSIISGQNVGLTNLTAVPVPGNALTPADLSFYNQPAPVPPTGPADTGDQGLGGSIPHLVAADMTQATGTIGINGTVTLNAPTSTEAGTFAGTITFTISS